MTTFNNDLNRQSQLDPGGVLKSAHSDESRALRIVDVSSLAKDNYSHFSVTYDESNNPSKIDYKLGTEEEITNITFVDDVAGSLNGTYFLLNSGRDNKEYYVWYNVDSTGTDPNLTGKTGIEVPISANDQDTVVGLATKLMVGQVNHGLDFTVRAISNLKDTYQIINKQKGTTTPVTDAGSTGFTFVRVQEGQEKVLESVTIAYDSNGNPIWEGQTLVDYKYDVFSGKFKSNAIEKTLDSINNNSIQYREIYDTSDPDFIYIGTAVPGSSTSDSVWRIQRFDLGDANIEAFFADSNEDFVHVWDDRATLTY